MGEVCLRVLRPADSLIEVREVCRGKMTLWVLAWRRWSAAEELWHSVLVRHRHVRMLSETIAGRRERER